MTNKTFTYISFGAGVQSSALLICSNLQRHGVPRADVAIFADTQQEMSDTYKHLERLRDWSDIPVHVASRGDLLKDAVNRNLGNAKRCASIPMWTLGDNGKEAPIRRQCTRDYKVDVCERHVRAILGYRPKSHARHSATCLIGISIDEAIRAKPSRTAWIQNQFPLIDAGLSRNDCESICLEHGFNNIVKSACRFCPYRGDAEWLQMKTKYPKEFARAVAADKALRDQTRSGLNRPAFVHRSLQPLENVDFENRIRLPLFDSDDQFGNECEGMCGV